MRQRTIWIVSIPVVALVALLSASATVRAQKIDVTGKWALTVNTDAGGTTMPSVALKQDGEKLTGHYSSATLGEAEVTGTVKGQDVVFKFTADAGGMSIEVIYSLTVENKDSMKGKISLGGLGEGTVTAKRQ